MSTRRRLPPSHRRDGPRPSAQAPPSPRRRGRTGSAFPKRHAWVAHTRRSSGAWKGLFLLVSERSGEREGETSSRTDRGPARPPEDGARSPGVNPQPKRDRPARRPADGAGGGSGSGASGGGAAAVLPTKAEQATEGLRLGSPGSHTGPPATSHPREVRGLAGPPPHRPEAAPAGRAAAQLAGSGSEKTPPPPPALLPTRGPEPQGDAPHRQGRAPLTRGAQRPPRKCRHNHSATGPLREAPSLLGHVPEGPGL